MTLREFVRSAILEISAHKTRSALTCLSLSIGVAAILFTFSQVSGTSKRYREALALAGPGRLTIKSKQGYINRGLSRGLTREDAEAIRRVFPELFMVYPLARRWNVRLRYLDFKNDNIDVFATTAEWRKRDWVYALRGRFLSEDDERLAARVCVVVEPGAWIKKNFWARYDPEQAIGKLIKRRDILGKKIRLDDHLYTVVGIIKEPPRDDDPRWFNEGGGTGGTILVPITAHERFLGQKNNGNQPRLSRIEIDTGDEKNGGIYIRRIDALLSACHRGEKDYEIKDFRQISQGAMQRMRNRVIAVLIIGIVAVLAGGIGIMNVTLATIFSRIREIGIRRALGATRSDIVAQFVTEAVCLGIAAGIFGVILGIAGVKYLSEDEKYMVLGASQVLSSFLIAMATGFLFSIFPAYKAARFNPIEALHYE